MCHQLELAEASMSTPHVTESTVVKPTLFHGRENENIDRWLQRFALYLANCKIPPTSDQAAIKLALHLSGPAETFYYNLSHTVKASYTLLRKSLNRAFLSSPAPSPESPRTLKAPPRTKWSLRKFSLADLNEKFNCLDLRDEDKLCYLIQGLRTDIQTYVLKKELKTYTEAEDAARLIYSIQQSIPQRRPEDITQIVHIVPIPSPGETSLLTGIQSVPEQVFESRTKQTRSTPPCIKRRQFFPQNSGPKLFRNSTCNLSVVTTNPHRWPSFPTITNSPPKWEILWPSVRRSKPVDHTERT